MTYDPNEGTIYEKARELGMFEDLLCPQEACQATMKIPHEAVRLEGGGVAYDCPSCGIEDRLGEDVMAEYVEDMNK